MNETNLLNRLLSPNVLPVISALGGTFLGSVFTLLHTWITRRSDERKHLRELLMRLSLEEWKEEVGVVKADKRGGVISPLYLHMAFNIKLARLFAEKNPSKKEIMDIIEDSLSVYQMVRNYVIEKEGLKSPPVQNPPSP